MPSLAALGFSTDSLHHDWLCLHSAIWVEMWREAIPLKSEGRGREGRGGGEGRDGRIKPEPPSPTSHPPTHPPPPSAAALCVRAAIFHLRAAPLMLSSGWKPRHLLPLPSAETRHRPPSCWDAQPQDSSKCQRQGKATGTRRCHPRRVRHSAETQENKHDFLCWD